MGGQFPYPVPQSSSIPGGTARHHASSSADSGTILNFIPQILANDVIRLDVEPVVSSLNLRMGRAVNVRRTRSIDERCRTVVELREGQTLAIAGLQLETDGHHLVGFPGWAICRWSGRGSAPTSIETIETETVILVTPELVAPLDKTR